MSIFDVIIVGAGPAGATLARALAKQGVRTLILEKAVLPRHKTCAGGVSTRAAKLLDFDISPAVERTIYGGALSYNLAPPCERRWPDPVVYLTSREQFDALLCERAVAVGAKLIDGNRVTGIERVETGFRIGTAKESYAARVLIGADGANGVTAEALGLTAGFTNGTAIECEIYPRDFKTIDTDLLTVDMGTIPAGYGWCFPKRDHLSIGAAGYRPHVKKLRPYVARLIEHYSSGGEVRRYRGGMLRVRQSRTTPITSGGALLLGEAAGLVNAFTGEGIYYAIKSALLAAPAVIDYLNGKTDGLDGYRAAIDRELMPRLGLSYTVAKAALAGGLGASKAFFDMFAVNQRLWGCLAGVLAGDATYAEFRQNHPALKPLLSLMGG